MKNIPLDRTVEDMRVMFTQYGKVLGLVPIPSRKNVIYMVSFKVDLYYCHCSILKIQSSLLSVSLVLCLLYLQYMEPKGAQIAIDNLHGKAISKHSKPMIVELSNVSP